MVVARASWVDANGVEVTIDDLRAAYKIGARGGDLVDELGAWAAQVWMRAWWTEGRAGHPEPTLTRGWRYGAVPASGVSVNHRDQTAEAGVSVAQVEGGQVWGQALWFAGRWRADVLGYVLTTTGADDEALMAPCWEMDE